MPIYEYRCSACNRRTSVFVRSVSSPVRATCEHCGSARLTRVMSKFAIQRGSGGGSDDFDDLAGIEEVDENDPRSVARWARRMRKETGEDVGPEFDEMIDRLEAGESPEDVMREGQDENLDGEDEF